MTMFKKSILYTVAALLLPHAFPIYMILAGKVASAVDVAGWPLFYIIVNLQCAWHRMKSWKCETEKQRTLIKKVYNLEGFACYFLLFYEGGSALSLARVGIDAYGVLFFALYFYVPYAILHLWAMFTMNKLINDMSVQSQNGRQTI